MIILTLSNGEKLHRYVQYSLPITFRYDVHPIKNIVALEATGTELEVIKSRCPELGIDPVLSRVKWKETYAAMLYHRLFEAPKKLPKTKPYR
jgi:hypothetical protein